MAGRSRTLKPLPHGSRDPLVGAALAAIVCAFLLLTSPAHAEPVNFDIEPQTLAQALQEYSRQTNTQLLYAAEDVAGHDSPGLSGTYEPLEALNLLLADTGLIPQQTDRQTVTLTFPPETDNLAREDPSLLPVPAPFVEEVTVTAARRENILRELPMTVTVMSGAELDVRNVRDVNEIANWLPSVQLSETSLQFGDIVIRGLKNTGVAGRAVDFLVDGATTGRAAFVASPALLDFERLEVLQGPQGTLYGEASLGGTIRLISVRPKFNELEGSIGTVAWATEEGDNSWQGDAVVNIPLVTDTLAARLGVSYEDRGGFVDIYSTTPVTLLPDQLVREDANTVEREAYRGAIDWNATDKLNIYLTARQQTLNTLWNPAVTMLRTPPGGDELQPAGDFILTPPNLEYTREPEIDGTWATMEVSYDFPAFALISESTIYEEDNGIAFPSLVPLPDGVLVTDIDADENQTNVSQEFRFVSSDNNRLDWVAGAYWRDMENSVSSVANVTFANLVSFFDERSERTQSAVFGNVKVRPVGRLALEFGIRLFREEVERVTRSQLEIAGSLMPADLRDRDDTFDVSAPRFALSFDLDDNMSLWGSVAKGFRGGSLNLNPNIPDELGSADPDENIAYEIGLKGRWLDNKAAASVALFYNDWRDIQIQVLEEFNGTLASFATNGESAHTAGIEGELTWYPVDAFRLSVMGHYMDSELGSTIRGQQGAALASIEEGAELVDAPKYSLAIAMDLTQPLTGSWHGYARVDLLARAGTFSQLSNEPLTKSEDYELGNLRFGARSDRWDLSIFVHNVWDERVHTLLGGNFVSPYVGSARVHSPRRVGLGVRHQF